MMPEKKKTKKQIEEEEKEKTQALVEDLLSSNQELLDRVEDTIKQQEIAYKELEAFKKDYDSVKREQEIMSVAMEELRKDAQDWAEQLQREVKSRLETEGERDYYKGRVDSLQYTWWGKILLWFSPSFRKYIKIIR